METETSRLLLTCAATLLLCAWSWVGIEVALTTRKDRQDEPTADGDDDVDGENFDDTDPGDWWKTKTGRAKNGRE